MKLKSFKKKQTQLKVFVCFKIKFVRLNIKRLRSSTINVQNQTENIEFMLSSIDAENAEFMSLSTLFKKRDRKSKKINFDVGAETDQEAETEID